MQLLITRSDIASYKQIPKTPHDDKINEQILDAQILDIQPLLGEKLFNSVMLNPDAYTDLLAGGVYEYDGITYTNYGLKMAIAYFAYARYIIFSSVISTPFSVVEKLNDTSQPVDISAKKAIYQVNRDAAFQVWESIKKYLLRTGDPNYKSGKKSMDTTGMRFTKII